MNITVNQLNDVTKQENINSLLITKMYEFALDANNTVSFSGYLYSDTGYLDLAEYLMQQNSPNLTITIPAAGLFMSFLSLNTENAIKTILGITSEGVNRAAFTGITGVNTFLNNTGIDDFPEFKYITALNLNGANFQGCTNLSSIDLNNAYTINNSLFLNCTALAGVVNAPNLISLGTNAFKATAITDVTDLGTIVQVPESAFENCTSLDTVLLPTSAIILGNKSFQGCSGLTDINLSNVTTFGEYCLKGTVSLAINANTLSSATTIKRDAFNGSFITGSLNCPNLTTIEQGAFHYAKIAQVLDLGSITKLPLDAFSECTSLTSVTLPSTLLEIGSHAFNGCTSLTSINLPSSLIKIDQNGIRNCSNLTINGLNLPNLTTIISGAFDGTNIIGDINLPSLTTLGAGFGSNITSVTSLGSLTSIPADLFWGCNQLTTLNIPNTITHIYQNAFRDTTSLILLTIDLSNVILFHSRCLVNAGFTGTADLSSLREYYCWQELPIFAGSKFTNLVIPANIANDVIMVSLFRWAIIKGMFNVTTITSRFDQWLLPPSLIGFDSLLPFVLYQPNLSFNIDCPRLFGSYWHDGQRHYGTTSWTLVYWPNLLRIYSSYFNDSVGLFGDYATVTVDLFYVNNLSTIDYYTFKTSRVKAVVMNQTTVPTIEKHDSTTSSEFFNSSFDMIYVPDSAVTTYQTAWPNHASKISSIHDLNSGVIYATEADWTAAGKPVGLIAEYLGLSSADLATFVSANNLTYWTNPNA